MPAARVGLQRCAARGDRHEVEHTRSGRCRERRRGRRRGRRQRRGRGRRQRRGRGRRRRRRDGGAGASSRRGPHRVALLV